MAIAMANGGGLQSGRIRLRKLSIEFRDWEGGHDVSVPIDVGSFVHRVGLEEIAHEESMLAMVGVCGGYGYTCNIVWQVEKGREGREKWMVTRVLGTKARGRASCLAPAWPGRCLVGREGRVCGGYICSHRRQCVLQFRTLGMPI